MSERPHVTTLCGSMRYFPEMLVEAKRLTEQGVIVLMPFVLKNAKGSEEANHPLNDLHKRKIDLSDSIVVIGIPGDSTRDEMAYAEATGKQVQSVTSEARRATYEDVVVRHWLGEASPPTRRPAMGGEVAADRPPAERGNPDDPDEQLLQMEC